MKIAHFLGTMRDPDHDGVTRVMYQMMKHFSSQFEHHYISPMLPKKKPENMHLVRSVRFPFSTDYKLSLVGKKSVADIFNDKRPRLIHVHTPCPLGKAAIDYATEFKIPYIITFHTNFPSYLKHYKVGFLEPLIWKYLLRLQKNSCATIVPSKSTLIELQNKGFKNLVNISHGVNTDEYSPSHRDDLWREEVGAKDKVIVLFVSRLVEEKNLSTLGKIPQFLNNSVKIKMVIVGDGPAKNKLEKMLPDAYFAGYLTGQKLLTAYASSDIFLFPSMTETFGNVTAEALASGLPCICANSGAAGDLIQNNVNGFLVTGNDPAEYAKKIDFLLENPQILKSMAHNCIDSTSDLQWEKVVKKYETLYAQFTKLN